MTVLTTLASVKQYGDIDTSADDALLTRMIASASATIENYCSREFASANRVEVRDGTGGRRLSLRNFPVTAVASVKINDRDIPARTSALGLGYTFDDLSVKLTGYTFTNGVDNVEIAYTGGPAAVPDDVDVACCEMVVTRYKARDRVGVSSKSLAGESISFTNDDLSDSAKRSLDQYRMVGLP